jgi:uncharacterized membrane protein
MAGPERTWTDQRIEQVVGSLLRRGVLTASAVVLAGAAVYLAQEGTRRPDYQEFRGEPKELRTLGGIARDALALNGRGVIQLGLVLLIATPVARVAFSAVAFAAQRDRTYVAVTLLVLAVLVFSLVGG